MTSRKKRLSNQNLSSIVSAVVGNTVENTTTTPGNLEIVVSFPQRKGSF